ncbi:MAG: hypothetical protein ABSG53_14815 [Thermoguttaceae bacterium]
MGLAVEVGMLADLLEHDSDGAEWLRETFASVSEVLEENKLPRHHEPESLPPLDCRASILSYPYSFLHHLRRIAAHVAEDPRWVATPFPESSDPARDALVDKHPVSRESHLLCHSDCEGFYVPIEFKDVIVNDDGRIPCGMLGSSFALLKGLQAIAPALGIRLASGKLSDEEAEKINSEVENQPVLWIEKTVWLSLFEAARLSIQHKAAICFN